MLNNESPDGVANREGRESPESIAGSTISFDQRLFGATLASLSSLQKRFRADEIVGAVLNKWFEESFPALGKPFRVSAKLSANKQVIAFASALANESILDAAYWLSSAYAKLSSSSRRKTLSMYFTPPALASRVLDELEGRGVDFSGASFLDPACGGSAFLLPIALRMRQRMLGTVPSIALLDHARSHLCGMDLDEMLCDLSKQFLRAVFCKEIQETGRDVDFCIESGNSLKATKLFGLFDAVVCNPPYRKMTAREVVENRRNLEDVLGPQPNLYGAYIALCCKFLKRSGYCAMVTPTSYLSGHSFSKLRATLVAENLIVSLGILSARQGVFLDVQQETAVSILKRTKPSRKVTTSVSIIAPSGVAKSIGNCVLPLGGSAWPIPRAASDVDLIARAGAMNHRIADYGYAIRVGHYVWNRDSRTAYTSEKYARRFNRAYSKPLIWSSDVKNGRPIKFDGMKRENGERRFVVVDGNDCPSIIKRPCVVLQRVTSNDQAKRLIAGTVPASLFKRYGGFVAENHTIILVPTSGRPVLSPSRMCSLLGCAEVDRLFRCISGATNVSVFELGQLPLPDPQRVRRELSKGRSIDATVRLVMGTK